MVTFKPLSAKILPVLLYFYDIKGNVRAYNSLKRRFYYQLERSRLAGRPWKTKSVLLVDDKLEKQADAFFRNWKPHIVVYKARAESLEEL